MHENAVIRLELVEFVRQMHKNDRPARELVAYARPMQIWPRIAPCCVAAPRPGRGHAAATGPERDQSGGLFPVRK